MKKSEQFPYEKIIFLFCHTITVITNAINSLSERRLLMLFGEIIIIALFVVFCIINGCLMISASRYDKELEKKTLEKEWAEQQER